MTTLTINNERAHGENRKQCQALFNDTDVRQLERGRTGYWDKDTGTVVIHDPKTLLQGRVHPMDVLETTTGKPMMGHPSAGLFALYESAKPVIARFLREEGGFIKNIFALYILASMPRTERIDIGGEIYHVINRANGRTQIFNGKDDYQLFESLLGDAKEMTDMRILAYTIMPNHWHLLLSPKHDGDLSAFMHWLTTTHTRRYHVATKTVGGGSLYQGPNLSVPVRTGSGEVHGDVFMEINSKRNSSMPHLHHSHTDTATGSTLLKKQKTLSSFAMRSIVVYPMEGRHGWKR
jgi:REP element-mobilizing transposase RayT